MEEEYELPEPVLAYEYKHPDNEEYRLEITDFGEDLSPRYEAWVFTGRGIGGDTACFQDDEFEYIKNEATEYLQGFIEMDLGKDKIIDTILYEGFEICTTENKQTVLIFQGEEFITEILNDGDLIQEAKEYIDILTKEIS